MPGGWHCRVSKAEFIREIQRVASLLKVRRLSQTQYRAHGRFYRAKNPYGTWASLCQEAGLIPTRRGFKGGNLKPCTRCRRIVPWHNTAQRYCKECRRTVNKRQWEPVCNWGLAWV